MPKANFFQDNLRAALPASSFYAAISPPRGAQLEKAK
jgi:hypothetical protein